MMFVRIFLAGIWGAAFIAAASTIWANLVVENDPARVQVLLPWRADALEFSLRKEIDHQIESSASVHDETAVEVFQKAPLSEWPFVQAALAAAHAGQSNASQQKMMTAYRRNPRNLFVVGALTQMSADAGDGVEALRWIDRLFALNPRLANDLRPNALTYVGEDGGLDAFAKYLKDGRPWARGLVGELNKTSEDFPTLLQLNRFASEQQASFVDRVLRERGPDAAFIAWLSLVDELDVASLSWPVDPGFEGVEAPPPFNWRLYGNLVEINPGKGLYAVYFGRQRQLLARQIVLLRPGSYKLVVEYSGDIRDAAGGFQWELSCLESQTVLSGIALDAASKASPNAISEFEVPTQGCRAQEIVLRGIPGEFPARAQLTTRSIHIEQEN